MDNGAVIVCHNLHLNVAGTYNVMLKVEFYLGNIHNLKDFLQLLGVVGYKHALATATGHRLQDNRIANLLGSFHGHFVAGEDLAALGHWYAGRLHGGTGHILISYPADGFCQWPNPSKSRMSYLVGKFSTFGEKAIAWVNGISIGFPGGTQDSIHVEIAFRGIGRANIAG